MIPGEGYPARLGQTIAMGPMAGRVMHSELQTVVNEGIQILTETLPWLPVEYVRGKYFLSTQLQTLLTGWNTTFICASSDLDSYPRSKKKND